MPATEEKKDTKKEDKKVEKPEVEETEENEEESTSPAGAEEEGEEGGKPKSRRVQRKENLREKLNKYLQEYKSALIVSIDNVGSNQMQKVRIALRGQAVLLMGKNTLIRTVIRENLERNPALNALLPHVKGNIGFVFTNGDLASIRKTIQENKVPAPAKSGAYAPSNVVVPAGPTGLDPGQTGFFQALNIATKIARGAVEIVNEVLLIKEGDRVSSSAVALLTKLNIKPFFFGIKVTHVFESGSVYEAKVLDLSPADLYTKFFTHVAKLTAIGLELGYPTLTTVPHSISNAFRKLLAVALEIDYIFDEAKKFKEMADNPEAFKAATTSDAKGTGAPAAEEEEYEEEEEEEDGDYGAGGLFGDE